MIFNYGGPNPGPIPGRAALIVLVALLLLSAGVLIPLLMWMRATAIANGAG